MHKLRVLDLFSGIGGFSLGLERTGGFETAAFCEMNEYADKVLAKHWPYVDSYEDVRDITQERLQKDGIGQIDVITGGYPCQPFSVAGQQKGDKDDRHLWPEMHRIISEVRPSWVIAENVSGHIKLGLDQVLFDLEAEGYASRAVVIPACAVDAPHRRDRVWIVAHASGERLQGCKQETGCVCGEQGAAPTVSSDRKLSPWGGNLGTRTIRNIDGLPRGVDRLKCLGNAVVPQIMTQIGYAILEAHHAVEK